MGNINLYKSSSASGPWSLVKENIQSPVTFDETASGLIYYAVRDEGDAANIIPSDYKVISEPVYVFGSTDKVSNITFDDATDLNGLIIKVTSTCGDASNHKVQVQINVSDTGWKDFTQVEIGSDIQATYTPTEEDGITEGGQIKFRAYIFNTTNANYRTNNSEEYTYTLEDIEDLNIYIDIPIPSSTNLTKKYFAIRKEFGSYASKITKFSYRASLDGEDILSANSLDGLYLPCLTSDFTLNNQAKNAVYNETFNGAKMLVASINILGININKQIKINYTDINTQEKIDGDVNFISVMADGQHSDYGGASFRVNSIPPNNSYYVIALFSSNIVVNMGSDYGYSTMYIRNTATRGKYCTSGENGYSLSGPLNMTFKGLTYFNNASVISAATSNINFQFTFDSPGGYDARQMLIINSSLLSTNSIIELSATSGV